MGRTQAQAVAVGWLTLWKVQHFSQRKRRGRRLTEAGRAVERSQSWLASEVSLPWSRRATENTAERQESSPVVEAEPAAEAAAAAAAVA